MVRAKNINLIFGIESLGCLVLGLFFYYFRVTRYFVSSINPIVMSITFISALVLISNFFASRDGILSNIIQVLLKAVNYILYLVFLGTIVNALVSVIWQQVHIPLNACFFLDVILFILLSLPVLYKLVIFENNKILRAISIFFFYYMIFSIPSNIKFGNTWFPSYSLVTLVAFILETALVIFAMHEWGYKFPRLKINHNINYLWLVILIIPSMAFMGFSAGSWSRLFSMPLSIRLVVADGKGTTAILVYIIFTILMTCFKEELIFRYLFLTQLFENQKGRIRHKVLISVLISSLLFGIWHLNNFNYQSVPSTLLQAFSAFAMGMVFSLICLYTGTIWITVIMHSIFDLFNVDKLTPVSPLQSQPNAFMIEFMIIASIIQIGLVMIAIYKLKTGPFEQTLNDNRLSKVPELVRF